MISPASKSQKIAIVGSGSIGAGWAIVFARAGFTVTLNDVAESQLERAETTIALRLAELDGFGLLADTAAAVAGRILYNSDLTSAIASADLVIEAAPENLTIKRDLFAKLAAGTHNEAILASSSSAITATAIAEGMPAAFRCLVAHPGNPPYLLPVVEIVPAQFTAPGVVSAAQALFEEAGMSVVALGREIEGFVFNRLQGAVLREAYCLVRDGVVSVDDLDKIVRDGLGMRYAFIGPFETSDLNVRGGISAHAARMAPAYQRMGADRGQNDPWTPELVEDVASQRRQSLPLENWDDRVAWRDRRLMALNRFKRDLLQDDN